MDQLSSHSFFVTFVRETLVHSTFLNKQFKFGEDNFVDGMTCTQQKIVILGLPLMMYLYPTSHSILLFISVIKDT